MSQGFAIITSVRAARGCEAMIALEDEDDLPEPEDEPDEDVRLFRTYLVEMEQRHARQMLMMFSRASPDEVVPPTEKTRRQILEVGYSDVDVYEQLRAFEAKIVQGGAELSDFRFIIAFDN